MGNIFASQITGRLCDRALATKLRQRGYYVPEDRLAAALWGSGLVLPGAVTALGFVLQYSSGTVGLVFATILLFLNGAGLMLVLTPTNTYCVDVFSTGTNSRASEVIAVNNCVRYLFSAAASAFVLPLVQRIGVGYTNLLSAGLCWIGFGLILLVIKYGERFRELGARWEGLEEKEEKEESAKGSSVATLVTGESNLK